MADRNLNLEGTVQPFGLLVVANTLSKMSPGEVLEIIVPDRELLDNILKIMRNSENKVLEYGEDGTRYWVTINKGCSI